jgi:hypothetical protein
MPAVPVKNTRELLFYGLFFLSRKRRVAIYRWMRGRREFRKLRRTRHVIVSCPKSGRTWLRVMISRFYREKYGLSTSALLGFDNFHKLNPAIPCILSTHDNYLRDYTGHGDSKQDYAGKKIVLLVRDPRDVIVSQFFQWKHRTRPMKKALLSALQDSDEAGIFDFATHPDHGIPRNMRFLAGWREGLSQLDDVLLVRYEDLRADTVAELEKILRFLGAECSRERLQDAVSFASFESMRRREQQQSGLTARQALAARDKDNPDTYKARRGKIGGFVDYFDPQQMAVIHELLDAELMAFFGYRLDSAVIPEDGRAEFSERATMSA